MVTNVQITIRPLRYNQEDYKIDTKNKPLRYLIFQMIDKTGLLVSSVKAATVLTKRYVFIGI